VVEVWVVVCVETNPSPYQLQLQLFLLSLLTYSFFSSFYTQAQPLNQVQPPPTHPQDPVTPANQAQTTAAEAVVDTVDSILILGKKKSEVWMGLYRSSISKSSSNLNLNLTSQANRIESNRTGLAVLMFSFYAMSSILLPSASSPMSFLFHCSIVTLPYPILFLTGPLSFKIFWCCAALLFSLLFLSLLF
jgi:hypothetical protein